jgi:hypothetical protein
MHTAKNAYKKDEYNHLKIECIGNEMKTWVNGVPAAHLIDTLDPIGFIGLQVHSVNKPGLVGKKVFFKNIRIKTKGLRPTPFAENVYTVVNVVPNQLMILLRRKAAGDCFLTVSRTAGWRSAKGKSFPDKGWEIKRWYIVSIEEMTEANRPMVVISLQMKSFGIRPFF